jgi:hypothetical protein
MLCGFCGNPIRKGEPVLFLIVPGLDRRKTRCVDCTSEMPPEVLPDAPSDPDPVASAAPRSFAPMRDLAFDWKKQQAGGDE